MWTKLIRAKANKNWRCNTCNGENAVTELQLGANNGCVCAYLCENCIKQTIQVLQMTLASGRTVEICNEKLVVRG